MSASIKRTVLITGASRGIGRQIAVKMAKEGHTVFVTSRSIERLGEFEEDFPGIINTVQCNLIDAKEIQNLFNFISTKVQVLDVLINNAGSLINKPFKDTTDEEWHAQLECNLMAPVRLVRNMLELMRPGSHIVNIGSMGGYQGSSKFPGLTAYSVSKGALSVLTECLAAELNDSGIAVNCLCLGAVQTEMLNLAFPGIKAPVNPSDMASFISYFSLNGQNFFNGKVLPVSLTDPK